VLDAEDLSVFADVADESRTAVHCPCTLTHGQRLGGALERVLGKVGIPLSRTTENHLCCGSAGTYSLLQPDMSERLLKRKLAALSIDDPEQIVTANVGCQLHLGAGAEIPVKHWIELLDSETSILLK
jgi:glycolate oxidase iron-sulfur subunit